LKPNFLFTPGPTHIPPKVVQAMAMEPLHHLSAPFSDLLYKCEINLQKIFKTKGEVAVLTSTGSGAMEAAAVNVVKAGDTVICIETGKFGRRWSEICFRLGCEIKPIRLRMGEDLTPEFLISHFRSYPDTKAVFLTHVETSSGAIYDIKSLISAIKEQFNPAIVVDVFSSLGADPFFQDDWEVDLATCGSQKALMCPPGLGIISVSKSGWEKIIKPQSLYWDLSAYIKAQNFGYTPFTPAVSNFNALKTATDIILTQGLENVWRETKKVALAFRKALESAKLQQIPDKPAAGLTTIKLPDGIIDCDVIQTLESNTGFRIAGGQEELAGKIVRVAHMGAIGYEDVKMLIVPLFDTLKRLGYDCHPEGALDAYINSYKKSTHI
jgi:aspartate aminotransferase-like enzyme